MGLLWGDFTCTTQLCARFITHAYTKIGSLPRQSHKSHPLAVHVRQTYVAHCPVESTCFRFSSFAAPHAAVEDLARTPVSAARWSAAARVLA